MRKFRFTLGMSTNKLGVNNKDEHIVELPREVTDEEVEVEWQMYLNNHLENLGYDPDDPSTNPFGGWEEING